MMFNTFLHILHLSPMLQSLFLRYEPLKNQDVVASEHQQLDHHQYGDELI